MKVVLFCGGQGMRLREYAENVPKPMVPLGNRPVLWHVMKYYAHFGHRDFILCLGYKGDVIKEYFLNYNEAYSNDFVLSNGGKTVELLESDIDDWRITFVDTGLRSSIGERLLAVQRHLGEDELFLANYADCLTDAPLDEVVDDLVVRDRLASFLCVCPRQTFHVVAHDERQVVSRIEDVTQSGLRINGGYFVLRREVFEYLREGEELVVEAFQRLIEKEELVCYPYDGFWAPMDTLKDKQDLEALFDRGNPPWALWETGGASPPGGPVGRHEDER